jgi:hypothetical protein
MHSFFSHRQVYNFKLSPLWIRVWELKDSGLRICSLYALLLLESKQSLSVIIYAIDRWGFRAKIVIFTAQYVVVLSRKYVYLSPPLRLIEKSPRTSCLYSSNLLSAFGAFHISWELNCASISLFLRENWSPIKFANIFSLLYNSPCAECEMWQNFHRLLANVCWIN